MRDTRDRIVWKSLLFWFVVLVVGIAIWFTADSFEHLDNARRP